MRYIKKYENISFEDEYVLKDNDKTIKKLKSYENIDEIAYCVGDIVFHNIKSY